MASIEVLVAGMGVLAASLAGVKRLLRFRYRRHTQRDRNLRACHAVSMAKREEYHDYSAERYAHRA